MNFTSAVPIAKPDLEPVPFENNITPIYIMGYNGEEAHSNIIWNQSEGYTLWTTRDKVVMEHLQNKSQRVVYSGLSMISCMAVSPDFSTLAVGHGHPNTKDSAQIILFSVAEG